MCNMWHATCGLSRCYYWVNVRPALTLIGCSSSNDSDKKLPSMRRNNRQVACKIGYSIAIAQQTHTQHTHTQSRQKAGSHTHTHTPGACLDLSLEGNESVSNAWIILRRLFFLPIFRCLIKIRRHDKGGTAAESEITVGTHDSLEYYYYNICDIE